MLDGFPCFERDQNQISRKKIGNSEAISMNEIHRKSCQVRSFRIEKFLDRYELEENDFLHSIVTGDESWVVANYTPKTKRQSSQWHHTNSLMDKNLKLSFHPKMAFLDKGELVKCHCDD